ncbi:MAG: PepSY domain-containing protein [Candidatus Obscuribacterales bacterium]|nr:PepSY domain-containing protein [Candidatus Obscuribacterales bacterium]
MYFPRKSFPTLSFALFSAGLSLIVFANAVWADGGGSLLKNATFTIEQAENLALSKYPEATVEEIELERDDTPLVWKIDLKMKPRIKINMEIDAKSGEILKNEQHKW